MISKLIPGKKLGGVSLQVEGYFRFHDAKQSGRGTNRGKQTTTIYKLELLNYSKLIWSRFTRVRSRNFIRKIEISQI